MNILNFPHILKEILLRNSHTSLSLILIYKIFISLHLKHSIIQPLTTILNVGQKKIDTGALYTLDLKIDTI